MKTTFFRSKTTAGDISHTYVYLQQINGHDVVVVYQKILVESCDADSYYGYEVIGVLYCRAIIARNVMMKVETLETVGKCVEMLMDEKKAIKIK